MLKSLIRISLMFFTGAFLKPRIKGLLVLLGFWLLLWFLQSEYFNYVDYSGDVDFVLEASLIKVILILLSLLIYALVIERRIYLNKALKAAEKSTSLAKLGDGEDDGFNFIRKKKALRDKSGQLLDK